MALALASEYKGDVARSMAVGLDYTDPDVRLSEPWHVIPIKPAATSANKQLSLNAGRNVWDVRSIYTSYCIPFSILL